MAEHDEFAAWAAESWRSSARWDEVISQLHTVVTKLAGDLKHAELQTWRALNDADHMSDILDLFWRGFIDGDNDDRQAAIDAYRKLRGLDQ